MVSPTANLTSPIELATRASDSSAGMDHADRMHALIDRKNDVVAIKLKPLNEQVM